MDHDNRESWLNRVAIGMAPLFEALHAPLGRCSTMRSTAATKANPDLPAGR